MHLQLSRKIDGVTVFSLNYKFTITTRDQIAFRGNLVFA
jgi:hypothetical protein